MSVKNKLFVDKLKPKSLNDIILLPRIKKIVGDGTPNVHTLFYGGPGLGKSSLSNIMIKDYHYIKINASKDGGVDTLRGPVENFITSNILSFSNNSGNQVPKENEKTRIIVLEELDGASDKFFKALRALMEEEHYGHTVYIANCNYINKIPEPIQSRFTAVINFDPISKDEEVLLKTMYHNRIGKIFTKLNINISESALIEFIDRNFPDLRKLVNKIQELKIQNITEVTEKDVKELNYSFRDVYDITITKPDPYNNYKMLKQYASKVDDILNALSSEYIEYLKEKNIDSLIYKIPNILIAIAKYQESRHRVIDTFITLAACIFEIQTIINS